MWKRKQRFRKNMSYFGEVWKTIRAFTEVNKYERGLDSTEAKDWQLVYQTLLANRSGKIILFYVCEH